MFKSNVKRISGVVLATWIVACTPLYQNHGYVPSEEDLSAITVGVDTRDTVATAIGVPSASGVLDASGYYYIRSRFETIGPAEPRVIERQVVAVSFDQNGVVSAIERFDLKDGQVVPLTRRVTKGADIPNNFLQKLLSKIGSISAKDVLDR